MVQAPAPARLIEGGLPTERLVAHVVVAKYADHCPLYRQAQILARQGITIDRATSAFWVGYAAAEIKPVWRLLRAELLSSTKLFVDETTAPVLDPGRGRTKKGYFWVLARDDRPWRGGAPPAVVYSYAPGRSGEHAATLLQGYTGVRRLQAEVLPETKLLRWKDREVPCLVIEYRGDDSTARTWVREDDGLVLRQEFSFWGDQIVMERDQTVGMP